MSECVRTGGHCKALLLKNAIFFLFLIEGGKFSSLPHTIYLPCPQLCLLPSSLETVHVIHSREVSYSAVPGTGSGTLSSKVLVY